VYVVQCQLREADAGHVTPLRPAPDHHRPAGQCPPLCIVDIVAVTRIVVESMSLWVMTTNDQQRATLELLVISVITSITQIVM